MGRRWFLAFLLVLAVLCLSSQGHGRRVKTMGHFGRGLSSEPLREDNSPARREMVEMVEMVMDYKEPGANTNPKNGALFNAPTPTPPIRH